MEREAREDVEVSREDGVGEEEAEIMVTDHLAIMATDHLAIMVTDHLEENFLLMILNWVLKAKVSNPNLEKVTVLDVDLDVEDSVAEEEAENTEEMEKEEASEAEEDLEDNLLLHLQLDHLSKKINSLRLFDHFIL